MYSKAEGGNANRSEASLSNAFECFSAAAARGSPAGWCNIGLMYEFGLGVGRDTLMAITCYENGAEADNIKAMTSLGRLLLQKSNLDRSSNTSPTADTLEGYKKALYWLRKAAERNDANAAYELGLCYYKGVGSCNHCIVPVDYAGALAHFKHAVHLTKSSKEWPLSGAALMVADLLYSGKKGAISPDKAGAGYFYEVSYFF